MSVSLDSGNGMVKGRFDGEWYIGELTTGNVVTYVIFQLTQPDQLEFYILDETLKVVTGPVIYTRRSTFSGKWQTEFGVMTVQRISEADAQALRSKFGTFETPPPASVSWYLGTYPWSGGGQVLAYTVNTYDSAKPPETLVGRYAEASGKKGDLRAGAQYSDERGLLSFNAYYHPDSGGTAFWSGKYLGPP